MRAFLFILSAFWGGLAQSQPALVGKWQYTSNIYQGKEIPLLNPALVLIFEFRMDHTDRLYWTRTDAVGFCERLGTFTLTDQVINDTVTWVNPQNESDCGRDPDMKLGRTAPFVYRVSNRLEMDFDLGNDIITYVWTRIP